MACAHTGMRHLCVCRYATKPTRDREGRALRKGTAAHAQRGKPWYAVVDVDTLLFRALLAPAADTWTQSDTLGATTRLVLLSDVLFI